MARPDRQAPRCGPETPEPPQGRRNHLRHTERRPRQAGEQARGAAAAVAAVVGPLVGVAIGYLIAPDAVPTPRGSASFLRSTAIRNRGVSDADRNGHRGGSGRVALTRTHGTFAFEDLEFGEVAGRQRQRNLGNIRHHRGLLPHPDPMH